MLTLQNEGIFGLHEIIVSSYDEMYLRRAREMKEDSCPIQYNVLMTLKNELNGQNKLLT